MNSDFKDRLRLFVEHDVKYLVVGGYAVSHHAQPRFTKDLADLEELQRPKTDD